MKNFKITISATFKQQSETYHKIIQAQNQNEAKLTALQEIAEVNQIVAKINHYSPEIMEEILITKITSIQEL